MKPIVIGCFFATLLTAIAANAGPHLITPDDHQGDDVRIVATEFFTRIAKGNGPGARELFTGGPDQAQVLEAEVRMVASATHLYRFFGSRFGANEAIESLPIAQIFVHRVDSVRSAFVMLNGDIATVSGSGVIESGISLHRSSGPGGWSVTELKTHLGNPVAMRQFFDSSTAAMDETASRVATAKLDTLDAAMKELSPRLWKAMAECESAGMPALKPGTALPASRINAESAPSLGQIRQCVGKAISSQEATYLIASLPGAPQLSVHSNAVYINSEETGVSLGFLLPGLVLRNVTLMGDGSGGYEVYPGDLPEGLRFGMTRRAVEKKLGPPPRSAGMTWLRYSADYRGLSLRYAWAAPRAADNLLGSVTFTGTPFPGPAALKSPRLAFRLVRNTSGGPENAEAELVPFPTGPEKHDFLVERKVLVDEKDIADVSVTLAGPKLNRPAINLVLTADGAKKMEAATTANLGRRMALVVDGKIRTAPMIASPMSRLVQLDGGERGKSSDVGDLLGELHAAVYSIGAN